jgi:WD40 repeat protein
VSEFWARARLEALVWSGLAQSVDIDALKGFLAEFPKAAHAGAANAKLAELESQAAAEREAAEREKRETDAWASASAAGTVAALEDFRQDWPNSKYADAACTRVETGLIRTFAEHTGPVYSVAFSPDGRTVLSGGHEVKLWVITTGESRGFAGHAASIVLSVAFSPDGRSALSGSSDETLKLWDVATGDESRRFRGHTGGMLAFVTGDKGWVYSVVFSPDGRAALSGSADKTLKLWNIVTGKEIRTFTGHTKTVTSVAFSPDGRTVLSGGHEVKLWDVATGKEIRTFTGHTGFFESVAFSPDGRTALFGGWLNSLKLWDVATGKEIRRFNGHTNSISRSRSRPMAPARCPAATTTQ